MVKRLFAASAAIALVAAGSAAAQEVKVGVALPYTGIGAEFGQQVTQGMELYLKLNAAQVAPYKITLIKRDVKERLLAETPPSQKAFGVFWRVRAKKLYFQSTSKGPNQELIELFARTFDLELVPVLPGAIADDVAKEKELEAGLAEVEPMKLNIDGKKKAVRETVEAK